MNLLKLLRSERGLALPLALAIMLVLSISIFAAIELSSANTRNASLNERRQSAKALAEAGVAHGAAFLGQQGPTYVTNFACSSTSTPPCPTIQGVTVAWSATYLASASVWTVKATAAKKNPTGPAAADVSRTVEAKFKWEPPTPPPLWNGLYIGNPGGRDFMTNDTASIATDVYARGNVRMTQGKFLGETFEVWGSLTLDSSVWEATSIGASDRAHAGSSTCSGGTYRSFMATFPAAAVPCNTLLTPHRVTDFRVKPAAQGGGCKFANAGFTGFTDANCSQTSANGGPANKIWTTCPDPCTGTNITSPAYSDAPRNMQLFAPSTPPTTWNLGPGKPCVPSVPSLGGFTTGGVDIMQSSSYSCKSADGAGELIWDASTNTLTAKGVIYFETNVALESGRHGLIAPNAPVNALIYVRDYLILKSNGSLCGKKVTPAATRCDSSWDPQNAPNLVSFVVRGSNDSSNAILQDNFHFQGGLYIDIEPGTSADKGAYFVTGTSTFKGPSIFEGGVQIQNSGTIDAWSPLSPPTGTPAGSKLTLIRGSWKG